MATSKDPPPVGDAPAPQQAPIRLRVRFAGRVQGVGFRATTHAIASQRPVTGWVRNDPDASVLAEFQGDPDAVHAVVAEVRGRMAGFIASVHADPIGPVAGESRFEIRR